MIKLYNDPTIKKWTVYVPLQKNYKEMKKLAIDLEENVNDLVAQSFDIFQALAPLREDLKKLSVDREIPIEELIAQIVKQGLHSETKD